MLSGKWVTLASLRGYAGVATQNPDIILPGKVHADRLLQRDSEQWPKKGFALEKSSLAQAGAVSEGLAQRQSGSMIPKIWTLREYGVSTRLHIDANKSLLSVGVEGSGPVDVLFKHDIYSAYLMMIYNLLIFLASFYFFCFDGYSRPSPLLPDNPAP